MREELVLFFNVAIWKKACWRFDFWNFTVCLGQVFLSHSNQMHPAIFFLYPMCKVVNIQKIILAFFQLQIDKPELQ